MKQERLNDAAIALCRILQAAGVKHGIFGGYGIGALGGPRESKDVDCIASITNAEVIAIVNFKNAFVYVNHGRDDYASFLWSDRPSRERASPGKSFRELGSRSAIRDARSPNLDPAGNRKVRAAALRDKYHDSADIRWLEGNYRPLLIERRDVVNLDYAGLAMKRYPELEFVFNRIGIDVQAAKARVAAVYLSGLPPPQNGDFQQGLHG
ncbi:MAG: hypothetical protein LQ340_003158 [Diploschistes diacapsis]|nr:MAG: hypothetical protein LQ340_003158 [Diploschistes diacapsis]